MLKLLQTPLVMSLVILMTACATVETEPVHTWDLPKLCKSIGTMRTLLVDHEINPVYDEVLTELRKRSAGTFSEREISAIREGELFIGMTVAAMECSWGVPVARKEGVGTWGDQVQHIYGGDREGAYVYTQLDRVTNWRNKD